MKYIIALCLLSAVVTPAQTLTIVASFNGTNGSGPNALVQGSDGNFYGTTNGGGAEGNGTVFRITPAGALTTLYSFGTGSTDGSNPTDGLIEANDGNFYGTTPYGGNSNWGIIFKITPEGELTTLYTPPSQGFPGTGPWGGLLQGTDGNLYGTMSFGGQSNGVYNGDGTVFKITPAGTLTQLHSFVGSDGSEPQAALIQATDGNSYGTTQYGGVGGCASDDSSGCGSIFKMTPNGTLTTLYSFGAMSATPDGAYPMAALIQATDGNFYGTTPAGGTGNCINGCATIFKITPAGSLTTLYNFVTQGGGYRVSGLLQASDGNFYGTASETSFVGSCIGPDEQRVACGSVFVITPGGAFTTLHRFGGVANDGADPRGSLTQTTDGSIYGTTYAGGANGNGTVFKFSLLSPDTPAIAPSGGVLNGASFQPGISPNSWMTISGTNLSSKTDTWNNSVANGALPTTLDGVTVMVGNQSAYIEYVSSTQINALAPNVPAGSVPVTVTTTNGTSQTAIAQLSAEQPAFFQWGNFAVATRQDFSLAVKNGTFSGTTTVPAKPGDVIILWGTGFGPTSPSAPAGVETPSTTTYNTANAVTVTVGGKQATVYGAALAPGYAGLYQIAIQIPVPLADGDYPVVATISGAQSPSTNLLTVKQ